MKRESKKHAAYRQELKKVSAPWFEPPPKPCQCARGCGLTGEVVHHKLRRSQGGGNDLDNLVFVAHICHNWIHDHPAEAIELGLLRRSGYGDTESEG